MSNTILFITHIVPFPPSAGNEIRIFKLLKSLKESGYRIILLITSYDLSEEALQELGNIVEEVYYFTQFYQLTSNKLKNSSIHKLVLNLGRLRERFIKKIFNLLKIEDRKSNTSSFVEESDRNDIIKGYIKHLLENTLFLHQKYAPFVAISEYVFMSPCLDILPDNVLKIIDTIDVFSRKANTVEKYGVFGTIKCSSEQERQYLLKSDVVIAIQNNEAKILQELVPERKVITVGIDYAVIRDCNKSLESSNVILVVASDNPLNTHGLHQFLEHSWPNISSHYTQAKLRIVGKVGNSVETDNPQISKAGWVADLTQEYQAATIVINPTIAGTGLKIKSVEALCHGKPLVAWQNGIEGINYSGKPPYIKCDSWSEFSDACINLLSDAAARNELEALAIATSEKNFSSQSVYAELLECLSTDRKGQ
jgi:glycosyltransferase involved in cell wall biosynthesis